MSDNVVSIDCFKEKQLDEKTDEVIDFIKKADNHVAIEFLAQAYIEYENMNKPELGDQLVNKSIALRTAIFLKLVNRRIDQLKENNEKSSD